MRHGGTRGGGSTRWRTRRGNRDVDGAVAAGGGHVVVDRSTRGTRARGGRPQRGGGAHRRASRYRHASQSRADGAPHGDPPGKMTMPRAAANYRTRVEKPDDFDAVWDDVPRQAAGVPPD